MAAKFQQTMLWSICLAVLVTAAATWVLKYEDGSNVDSKNAVHNKFSQLQKSKQHLYTFHSNQNDEDAVLKADFGQISLPTFRESSKCPETGGVAHCSHRGIDDLSKLQVSTNITGLDLSYNNIELIPDGVLANFTKLEWLDISHNKLQMLSNNSFYNLSALKTLKLQGNSLSMSEETFPEDVFKPLVSLQRLWIQNNTHVNDSQLDYPDKALAHLKSLTNLHMDGLPHKILGEGFRNMTSLTKLVLMGHAAYVIEGETAGHCNLKSLAGDMFINVPGITDLHLIYCKIDGELVNSTVFKPLINLTSLDLSHNDALKFKKLAEALEKIQNYSLKVLNISNIINPYSPGVAVTQEFCKSLPRQLEELNATSNALETFKEGALQYLPTTLKVVDVGSNRFLFWTYLKELDQLVSLKYLTISGGAIYALPWYYPPETNYTCSISYVDNQEDTDFSPEHEKHYLTQPLPPKLEVVNMINGGLSNYLTEFHFNETNSLNTLNIDSNNFPILRGPITGLHSLHNLSMTECGIREIYPSFFQNLTSLVFLNLSSNYFGNMAFKDNQSLFSELVNLTFLDLSFTDINCISEQAFQGLHKLEILWLQRNPFTVFNVNISFSANLMYINLSSTYVMSLSPEMTGKLDDARKYTNLSIDFLGNRLDCSCRHVDFIKWMTTTRVLLNTTRVTCSYSDGSDKHMEILKDVYAKLQRECSSNLQLFSVVISATFLVIFAIAGVVLYTFRRRLQYLYHSAKLHYKNQRRNNIEESFEYDVFVSYAHEDHDFVVNILHPELQSQGLKIHIHGLHFVAGEYISSNIVNAVRSSRHTLVILTQHHVSSKWSKFEVEMANMEQVHTGRPVLVFLIKENVPKLSPQMRFHIKNNTYINYPRLQDNQLEMQVFWSRLVSALKS